MNYPLDSREDLRTLYLWLISTYLLTVYFGLRDLTHAFTERDELIIRFLIGVDV
jgi:hypothetical protein